MTDSVRGAVSTDVLAVVWLLQNPLGQEAPPGVRGDLVRISDGRARVYLLPGEFDMASPATLRWLLAQQPSERGSVASGYRSAGVMMRRCGGPA
jgi:hypothetical protein